MSLEVLGVIAWILWTLWFAVWEWRGVANKRKGDTLSESMFALFHMKTWQGRLVFSTIWIIFAVWFFGHLNCIWPWETWCR